MRLYHGKHLSVGRALFDQCCTVSALFDRCYTVCVLMHCTYAPLYASSHYTLYLSMEPVTGETAVV
jgi:hypothetical protein